MPLKYYLIDNTITPDPDDRRAVTLINQSYTLEAVIDEMISRGSTVTKAEALSVFEELNRAIEVLVKNGSSVNTPLFNVSPAIVGVFASDDDGFDSSKHKVKLRVRPGTRLRQMEDEIAVEKIMAEKSIPVLLHFFDNATDTVDEVLTPGGVGRIVGNLLKIDESDNLQGVFFVNAIDGTATKVSAKFVRNKPGELIFVVPDTLVSGPYRVEVRALFKGSRNLRTGSLQDELTVA